MNTADQYRSQIAELRSLLRIAGTGRQATRLRGRISRLCAAATRAYHATAYKTPDIRRQMNAVLRLERHKRIVKSREARARRREAQGA